MNVRQRCFQIFQVCLKSGITSIRSIARFTQCSKSSVHRHQQAIKQRNLYPESKLWEIPEGYQWLRLLVFATVYVFGIQQGVGGEAISRFFHLLRLQYIIGVSPTSLRRLEADMRQKILDYQTEIEQQLKSHQMTVSVSLGADETFFPEVVLVLMDLVSGYIILEDKTTDRQYLTWHQKAVESLKKMGQSVIVMSIVSDRAKALIQLAVQGFNCPSIPDLFHAMRGLSKAMGCRFGQRLTHLKKQLRAANIQVLSYLNQGKSIPLRLQQQISAFQAQYNFIETGQQAYHNILHQITCIVHPFAIDGSGFQTTTEVATLLYEQLPLLAILGDTYQIAKLDKALETFSAQIPGIAAGINLWWQAVEDSLQLEELSTEMSNWLLSYLLPNYYWSHLTEITKNPALKQIYHTAQLQAVSHLIQHPLTYKLDKAQCKQWQEWALRMVNQFQRSSSAIEGRNGYLSRVHHCGRGFDQTQLQVLTVIHNFELKRADGSTAAQRLFGKEFPNLFDYVIQLMGDLPLPRKSYSFSGRVRLSIAEGVA